MFGGLGKLFKGDEGERTRARYQAQVLAINALEPEVQGLSDDELRARTVSLRQRAQGGAALSELLVEAFAVREPNSRSVFGVFSSALYSSRGHACVAARRRVFLAGLMLLDCARRDYCK